MSDVQTVYAAALESPIAKLRSDTYIVAAMLAGSMAKFPPERSEETPGEAGAGALWAG